MTADMPVQCWNGRLLLVGVALESARVWRHVQYAVRKYCMSRLSCVGDISDLLDACRSLSYRIRIVPACCNERILLGIWHDNIKCLYSSQEIVVPWMWSASMKHSI